MPIIPCQEGEEISFVQGDDFLREIAFDAKEEIARNVLSPTRAKGLEFARVVLYKFGEHGVSGGHAEKTRSLIDARTQPIRREETLGLEYFLNALYVGA